MSGPAAVLVAALELAEEGLPVFPCQPSDKRPYTVHGFKDASIDPAEIKRWWRRWPGALVGVPAGSASGLLVIDTDPTGADWHRANDHRLACGRVHRTRRGHHLLYRYPPDIEIRNSAGRLAPGVDVRAEGGYFIFWPCHGFQAIGGMEDLGPLPDWLLVELNGARAPHAGPQGAGEYITEGHRNDFLSREGYRLGMQGCNVDQIIEVLRALNNARCSPRLLDAEVAAIVNGKARVPPGGAVGGLPPLESYDDDAAREGAKAPAGCDVGSDNGAAPAVCESRVVVVRGDALSVEPIRWQWKGWIARGKLHMLAGAPGAGKSTIALTLAAVVTTGGRWPDGTKCDPGDVLVWSGEDDPADTLLPRLLVAGGDPKRFHIVKGTVDRDGPRQFDPATDIPALITEARKIPGRALVIVDPVVTVVPGDSHKNVEVRRALQPLVGFASDLDAAVFGISHFTKGTAGRDPVDRVTGSVAFGALPRVVMAAARVNEGGAERRIFCRAKSNIGPDTGGWEYRLDLADVAESQGVTAVYARWGEVLEGSARDLLAEAETTEAPEERDAVGEAEEWLGKLLKDGPVDSKEIPTAAKQSGIAWRTIERAKTRLGVKSRKRDFAAGWWWSLPEHTPPEQDTLGGLGKPTPLKPSSGAGSTEDRQAPNGHPPSTPLKPSSGAVPPKTVKPRKEMKALADLAQTQAGRGFQGCRAPMALRGLTVFAQTQAWCGFQGIVKTKTVKTVML